MQINLSVNLVIQEQSPQIKGDDEQLHVSFKNNHQLSSIGKL